jgi:hypothetical protein
MDNSTSLKGYLSLVNRMIKICFFRPIQKDSNNIFKKRMEFAKESNIISHFCDINNINEKKLRQKIYFFNLNQLNKHKDYKKYV